MSRPFCLHVAMLQDGQVRACTFYCFNKLVLPLVISKLRVVQFWPEIKLVIKKKHTPASRSCDFVITLLILDQIAIAPHLVQLLFLTVVVSMKSFLHELYVTRVRVKRDNLGINIKFFMG